MSPGDSTQPEQGQGGHWSEGGKQMHCTPLALYIIIIIMFPFLFCPIKLSSSQPLNFTFLQFSPPSPGGGVSKHLRGAQLPAGSKHNSSP